MQRRSRIQLNFAAIVTGALGALCFASPCFAQASDPYDEILIEGWWKPLPFQRVLDLELSFFSGFPDVVAACVEANPRYYLSVDACAGTMLFYSGLSTHVASRFLHYVSITATPQKNARGGLSYSYSGYEFGAGPSIGYRSFYELELALFGNAPSTEVQSPALDAFVSIEGTYWINQYFGLGLQLDAGMTYVTQGFGAIPNGKLSLGFSF